MTDPSQIEDVAWQERAFVTISQKGGTDIDFHALMSEISFSGGSKGVEGQPLMNGGRMTQYNSQEDFEFSATLYIIGVKPEEGTGIAEFFHGSEDQLSSSSGQHEFVPSLTRADHRIACLWTEDASVTSAVDEVAAEKRAYRWIAEGAKLTDYEQSFDDMVLEVEVTFTIPPFDAEGAPQLKEQENTGTGTDALEALGDY